MPNSWKLGSFTQTFCANSNCRTRLAQITNAAIPRYGGGPLLRVSRRIFPFLQRVFADSGYAGQKAATATLIAVEIVCKNPDQVGFAVNPRRWVVDRFFAWIGRNRRLAKDFEATIDSARAFHTPHPSCCSCDGSLVLHDFRNRL